MDDVPTTKMDNLELIHSEALNFSLLILAAA